MNNEFYEAGKQAYENRLGSDKFIYFEDNPHNAESEAAEEWSRGWTDAECRLVRIQDRGGFYVLP